MRELKNHVNGDYVQAAATETLESKNPAAGDASVRTAVSSAANAATRAAALSGLENCIPTKRVMSHIGADNHG